MDDLDTALVTQLDDFMDGKGFKYIKSKERFVRKTGYGFEEFVWYTNSRLEIPKWMGGGFYEGDYGIGLRHDKLEKLMEVLELVVGKSNIRNVATVRRVVTGQHFPFEPSRDQELKIRVSKFEDDTRNAVERITSMLEKDGDEWFKRYSEPFSLLNDINSPAAITFDGHPLVNNPAIRPLKGIAVAIVYYPEQAEKLKCKYLTSAQESTSQTFFDLLERRFNLLFDEGEKLGYL